jgi:PAS domain S-box-containing protein
MSKGRTILVVEDNPTTRKMLRVALQVEGYTVLEAADARTALAEFAQGPDLVIQDLILPDMDGLELVRQLRAAEGGQEVPILALSGFVGRLEEPRTAQAGFTGLLVKPIEPSRLVEAVRAHLPGRLTAPDNRGGGRRVLLVDDDPVQLKLMRLRFSQAGFRVKGATSGAEALAAVPAEVPHIIVSDVFMPEMDGFQLCMEVRRHPLLAQVPVVLMSAQYGNDNDQSLSRKVGASALVTRTPDLDEAIAVVLAALASGPPAAVERPSLEVQLAHARAVNDQLERQLATSAGLAQRCTFQAAQLSLLSGVAEALAKNHDPDLAIRDVLAATLDAAGISKGALFLRSDGGQLRLRQSIGFTDEERGPLADFFGQRGLLDWAIDRRAAASVPSSAVHELAAEAVLTGAHAASVQIVPVMSDARGVGVIVLAATQGDVTSQDAIAFARAMGNQMLQSLALAETFARLSASELRYRTLLDRANDAIAVLDTEGRVREVNRRWEEILGLPREQIVGRGLGEFSADGQSFALSPEAAPLGGPGSEEPIVITRADGGVVLMEFAATALELAGEGQIFSVGRDVTDRVRANEQLIVSDRMASVGLLAAGVAHEINNPLAAVMANLDLAAGQIGNLARRVAGTIDMVEIESMLGDARRGAERVRNIVRDLRIFSRAEVDRLAPVDTHRVLDSALRMAWNEIRHRAQVVKSYGQIPYVMANESRLGQVFLNVVVNAAQAIAEGQANAHQIAVRTAVEPGSTRVLVEITDTGPGIPHAVLARLFTPFFTTKAPGVGTGLGLAISRRIITGLGGDITIDSQVGRGTVVRILIPVARDVPEEVAPPMVVERSQRRGRILVVDDEPMMARAVLRFLGVDHEVVVLGDGQEALSRLDQGERFDVIVCDLMMPTVTGMDLHAKLSVTVPDQASRMVFLTGGAFTPRARAFLDEVPNVRLEKPFEMQTLRAIVNDRLRRD